MKAEYGVTEASGAFFITIDTERCDGCEGRDGDPACLEACPGRIFSVAKDDWKELVALVGEEHRAKLATICGACKPPEREVIEPCHAACPHDAIRHSW